MKVSMVSVFAFRRTAALRAGGLFPGGDAVSTGFHRSVSIQHHREVHRQLLIRDRKNAAFFAEDHGNGGAPVTLAGDQPVADAVGGGGMSGFFTFQKLDNFRHSLIFGYRSVHQN